MKPLTIEQLKALKVRDWVWVVDKEYGGFSKYKQKLYANDFDGYYLFDYGTTWLAYKNKEQAEAKGEIVELPCNVGDTVYRLHRATKEIVEWEIDSIKLSKSETIFVCGHKGTGDYMVFGETEIGETFFTDKTQAEAHLKELQSK